MTDRTTTQDHELVVAQTISDVSLWGIDLDPEEISQLAAITSKIIDACNTGPK